MRNLMYTSRPSRRSNVSITAFMYPLWRYNSNNRTTSRRNSSSLKYRFSPRKRIHQIGRASCRERVEISVAAAAVKQKKRRDNNQHEQLATVTELHTAQR